MFESGAIQPGPCASDRMRGGSGEVSRYQIMPEVWRCYTKSLNYSNPEIAWLVASRIIEDRIRWFRESTGRSPDGVEVYLLWNKPGHFGAAQFEKSRVKSLYRNRAQRFANLWRAIQLSKLAEPQVRSSAPQNPGVGS